MKPDDGQDNVTTLADTTDVARPLRGRAADVDDPSPNETEPLVGRDSPPDVARPLCGRAFAPTANLTDEDLLTRITNGDPSALEPLAERYYSPLFAYAFRLSGGDRALAEDAVQDAFVKILTQRTYQPGRPAKPWLYRIATNCVVDRLRKTGREDYSPPPDRPDADPQPEPAAIAAETAACVRDAVRSLPFDQRAVLVLRYYHDLPLADVAAALEIPVGTVKSRLHAAIIHLRSSSSLEANA